MKTICIDAGHGGKDPGACAGGVRVLAAEQRGVVLLIIVMPDN